MNASIEMDGLKRLQDRLRTAKSRSRDALRAATEEAMVLIFDAAKENLDAAVYRKARPEYEEGPDKGDSDSMWNAFFQELSTIATGVFEAIVGNTSPHAPYLEYGTDNEGTGSHMIPEIRGVVLHWIDAATGGDAFARSIPAHSVRGIKPIRFLERAIHEHREAIVAIYRKHLEGLFR